MTAHCVRFLIQPIQGPQPSAPPPSSSCLNWKQKRRVCSKSANNKTCLEFPHYYRELASMFQWPWQSPLLVACSFFLLPLHIGLVYPNTTLSSLVQDILAGSLTSSVILYR